MYIHSCGGELLLVNDVVLDVVYVGILQFWAVILIT